jgi:hypothetical protein
LLRKWQLTTIGTQREDGVYIAGKVVFMLVVLLINQKDYEHDRQRGVNG